MLHYFIVLDRHCDRLLKKEFLMSIETESGELKTRLEDMQSSVKELRGYL